MASLVQGLVKEAKDRQKFEKKRPNHQQQKKSYPASHSFLVSSNWKSIESSVSRKAHGGASEDNIVALDCEMVGVGPKGEESVLARVSIVDFHGNILCDEYVRPNQHVSDYRQKITGIKPFMLREAKWSHDEALVNVRKILDGKVVVGHAVDHDFKALEMDHPLHLVRDTSVYRGLRLPNMLNKKPALKKLANHHLNRNIQEGIHCSVEDARIALQLYKLRRPQWEQRLKKAENSSVPDAVLAKVDEGEVGEAIKRDEPKKKKKKKQEEPAGEAVKRKAEEEPAQPSKKQKKEQEEEEEKVDSESEEEDEEVEIGEDECEEEEDDGNGGLVEESFDDEKMSYDELLKQSGEEKGELLDLFKQLSESRDDYCFKSEKLTKNQKKNQKRKERKAKKAAE